MKKLLLIITLNLILFSLICQEGIIHLPEIITYIYDEILAVEHRQTYTAEEIEERNLPDLPSIIATSGIQLLSYGPYGLEQKASIRGFTDETVRVVIDGVCVNNSQYGTFDLSTINLDDIEKIEIVRGGFTETVCDEDSIGGVIYITTKKQELGTHFHTDSSIKTYFNTLRPLDTYSQTLGFNTQIGNNFLKFNTHGTFAHNNYLYNNYEERLFQREHAEVLDGSTNFNYVHYFSTGDSVSVTDNFYAGKKNTPGAERSINQGNQKDYDNLLNFQLIMPEVAEIMRLESNLAWLSNTRFYVDNSSNSKHYVNSIRYNIYDSFDLLSYYKQALGLSFDYTYLNSTNDGIHNQFSGALKSTSKFYVPLDENSQQFLVSVPLAVKFCGQNFAFTPKLGMGFELKYLSLFIDGYRMTQFPNMDDLYWEGDTFKGNPDLIPETGWGGEFTLNTNNPILPFSISVFTNYYENKIQWAGFSPQNVASAFYLGCDLEIKKSFCNEKYVISSTTEYLYTKLLSKANKYTYGKKIMWTPDLVSNLTGSVNLHNVGKNQNLNPSFVMEINYVGKRYVTNTNTQSLDPYVLLNFSSQLTCSTVIKDKMVNFTPYLRADNLLNWDYEAIPNYPMPGISLTVGCKIVH